jgi:hypothetical protein
MIRDSSMSILSLKEMEDVERSLPASYRYNAFVIEIKKVVSDGPCPASVTPEAYKLIKNDYLITLSSLADGSGVLSYRQILSSDVVKNKLGVGSSLVLLQERGRSAPEGLYLSVR